MSEAALAHASGNKIESAYARSDVLAKLCPIARSEVRGMEEDGRGKNLLANIITALLGVGAFVFALISVFLAVRGLAFVEYDGFLFVALILLGAWMIVRLFRR